MSREREGLPMPRSIGHEGMVTVWSHDGRYLGGMSVETWTKLLAEHAPARAAALPGTGTKGNK